MTNYGIAAKYQKTFEWAKSLEEYKNPSTLVYRLIESMERG